MNNSNTVRRYFFLFAFSSLAFSITSCATFSKLDGTPKAPEAFKLPPDELMKQYPDVAGYHLPNVISYRAQKASEEDSHSAGVPSIDELKSVLGEPIRVDKKHERFYRFFSQFTFGYSLVVLLNAPEASPEIFAISIIPVLAGDPLDYIWEKGDYRIRAEIPFSGKMMSHWAWNYRANKDEFDDKPIVSYSIFGPYVSFLASGFDFRNARKITESHLSSFQFLLGYRLTPLFSFDNTYAEFRNNFFNWIREKSDTRFTVGFEQQLFSLSVAKNLADRKREIGAGIWYDTVFDKVIDTGYLGKVGAFFELTYLKTTQGTHGLQFGFAYPLDNQFDVSSPYLRFQLFWRPIKYKRV